MRIEDQLSKSLEELQSRLGRLERELDHSQRLASLGMVLGIIAHEFNNILTPVLSYSQMALANPDDAELTAKALRRAADGAEKAAKIASSVLNLARKEGYQGEAADRIAADVQACLNEALECLALDTPRDGLEILVAVPRGTRAAIDPVALQQVFVNLVLNARKSLKGGRGRISIRVRSTRNTHLLIEVEDNGRGIGADPIDRIFDPFVSESTTPQEAAGTGLGLAICRRLIEAAGGTIDVASVVGEGSCFTVDLPQAKHGVSTAA